MGYPIQACNSRNAEVITCRFTGNSTGTPTKVTGEQLTLARTGVGVYTLTITTVSTTRRKTTLQFGEAKAILAGAIPLHGKVALASGVFTITFYNASGVATDPGVSADCNFLAVVS